MALLCVQLLAKKTDFNARYAEMWPYTKPAETEVLLGAGVEVIVKYIFDVNVDSPTLAGNTCAQVDNIVTVACCCKISGGLMKASM